MSDLFGTPDIAAQVQAEKAYGPIYGAQYQDAQKSAKANELGHRLGIPADVVDADIPNMMAQDRVNRAIAHARQNAAYAQMMSNPRLAAAGIDDEHLPKVAAAAADHQHYVDFGENIRKHGWLVGSLANVGYGAEVLGGRLLSGVSDVVGSVSNVVHGLTEISDYNSPDGHSVANNWGSNLALFGAPALLKLLGSAHGGIEGIGDKTRYQTSNRTFNDVSGGIESVPSNLAALAATAYGGPAGGAAAFGAQAFGDSYEAGRKAGLNPNQAGGYGVGDAAIMAGATFLPEKYLGGVLAGKGSGVGAIVSGLGGMGIATGLQGLNRWYWIDRHHGVTFDQFLGTLPDDERTALTGTMVALGLSVGGAHLAAKVMGHAADTQAAANLDTVMDAAAKSPTRTSNPTDFENALNQVVGDNGDLYVPSDKVLELFQPQEGKAQRDLRSDPFWGRYAPQIEEAGPLGADVVVPLASAATHLAGTPDWAAIREHVRTRPGGASMAEVRQAQSPEELEALAAEVANRLDETLPQMKAQGITRAVADALGYKGEQADAISHLLGAGLHRAYSLEVAKREAAGEPIPSMEDFAAEWLPEAQKTTQAKLDAERAANQGGPLTVEKYVDMYIRGEGRDDPEVVQFAVNNGPAIEEEFKRRAQEGVTTEAAQGPAEDLSQSANPDQPSAEPPPEPEKEPIPYRSVPPISPEMLRKIMRGGAAIDEKTGEILQDTQRRGNITIDRDAEGMMVHSVIRAFEASDFSTAIHETGHFFLEDLKRRALRTDATEQEKSDWQAVKDWAGEQGHGVSADNLIPEPAHETFARGFERYIYEGRAPSAGLKAVFAKMRDFMVSLYRSVRSFNAPITPQIRDVMDRLLASDDEINARRQELRLGEQNLSELMSKDEQARYAELGSQARDAARDAIYDRVLSTIRAERSREVSKRKGEIRQEVSDQVDAQPIFRALKMLRSGVEQEDRSTQRATLPREWLVDNYGEGVLDKLPKGVPPIYDDAHGVDPESIATRAGFDSGDQMVQKLLDHEEGRQQLKANGDTRAPRRAMIESTTEQRLRSEMGDPFANLEEEADAALANDRQADALSMELRALSRKTGGRFAVWKEANDWARAHVRQQSSKDAISGAAMQMYSRSAAKAADNVEEALVRKDYEAAFRAKQQQVLNLALMKQAKDAKDEVLAGVKRLRKVAKATSIPSVDQDYLDQAHQLLESVDMKNRPAKAVDKRLAFEAWHQKQVEIDIDPIVPPEYRATLGQTHWTRLSINDLLDLDKAVKQIVKLGRLKQELKDGAKKRAFNEGVSEMQDRGGQVPPRSRRGGTTDPRKSPIGRAASRIRSIDAAMLKTEQVCIWLDNHDPTGPWQRLVYRPFAEAQGRYSDLTRGYGKEINDLIKSYPKKMLRGLTRKVDTPELVIRNSAHLSNGEAWHGTKDQVLAMALNWGNLGNRQRLLDGFGWNENAVASVFDRTLTKEDWDFVQGVWDTVDKLWPDVAKLEREVNGIEPEKIEAAEVPTPHGTYRGGYFPIVYDPMQTTGSHQAAEDKGAPSGGWWTLSTRSSATKERAEQVKGRPLMISLSTITHHMHEVIHDITHRQAVNQVKRLLADDRVAGIVNTRMGPEYTKAMRSWLENVAKPNHAYSRANPAVLWVARYLNKAITTVGLGFRVGVSLKQLLGVPFSAKELGSDHIAKGMAIVMAHPVQAYNEMVERSAEMRARSDHIDASIEDMRHDLANGKLRQIGPRGITRYAFQGIVYMDVVSRTTVWTSGYNKAIGEGMGEQDAVAYADRAVRQSHGIGFQKDRAAIQYDHPFARALWPFFSYLNALYNAQRDVGHRVARAETAGDYTEAARRAWWVFAVPALLSAVFFDDGPEDKDGNGVSVGDWAEYLGTQVLLGNLASLPVVGNLAQALGHGYSYRAISYQQIGDSIAKAWKQDKKIAQGDSEVTGSSIKHTMDAAGEIFAKPLGQIGATSGGLYDYATGAADPQTGGDWYNLLTRGYIPEQPTAAERLAGRSQ